MHTSIIIAFGLVMTLDLENLFSNAHLHGEYLCQVWLKSLH